MKNLINKLGKALLLTSFILSLQTRNIGTSDIKYKDDRYVVVIDPGHGNNNKGNWPMSNDTIETWEMDYGRACYKNYCEEDLNLKMAKNIEKMLDPSKYKVILTRRDNLIPTPLGFRAEFANELDANLFMSIHVNEHWIRYVRGCEAFYRDSISGIIADSAINNVVAITHTKRRKAKLDTTKRTTVLENIKCPGILIEVGFITNSKDKKYILDTVPDVEEAIAKTIEGYFENRDINSQTIQQE